MKHAVLIFALLIGGVANGQVTVDRNFGLELAEQDSTRSQALEQSLSGFLTEAKANAYTSRYVDPQHMKKYGFFFQKLAGIGAGSDDFFNPTVLKSYSADGEDYRLTVGFYGSRDGSPFIFQVTELKAVPFDDHYRFYCPFEDNTAHYEAKRFDTVTYHFSQAIDESKAVEFARFKRELSKLTNTPHADRMYRPFIQGLATYYGGYGLSYESTGELKQQFRDERERNPALDFLEEFKKGRKSSINRHFSFYVMSAFLCEEVLKSGDFDDVLKLVYSGREGELFFENLHDVLGINEENFHESMLELIG